MKPVFLAAFLAATSLHAEEVADPPIPPPLALPRAGGVVTIDGDLGDPAWQGGAVIDSFYETAFGDNREPIVKTTAYVMYDDRYFYLAVRCDDPEPAKIRAPYVDRDQVLGTDDNVAIFLDTRGDRRSAQEFRVNPRGNQADAIFNDANGNEDFAPDFYYDTAARIGAEGWTAEMRIPLTSLRYSTGGPQKWGIIVWRNYPRAFRYAIYSSPQPRGSNCNVCHARELTEIAGLPSSSHFVVAPYASAADVASAAEPGAPLEDQPTDKQAGIDLKWSPSANTALDATLNPDFSQVEGDVAQIAVNNRFALFFPEKRPFFLEGVDLFDTPIQAVYTRTITSPRWGARSTGKLGSSSYTLLLAQDRGGGSVILPGATASDFAPQDFRSVVGIGRWRRDLGASFLGLLYAGRELEGGGHNRVFGPDAQWRPSESDTLSGQFLISDTKTPDRPEVASEWDGRSLTSHALNLSWSHSARTHDWTAKYRDFGDDFRADLGFVPQVGYRQGVAQAGYRLYPSGLFNFVRPFFVVDYARDRHGALVNQRIFPAVFLAGRRNLQSEIDINFDRVRSAGRTLPRKQLAYFVQVDPSRRITRVGANGFFGEEIDFANARVGRGGNVTGSATLRPTDHLTLDVNSAVSWLNVDDGGRRQRLFTAQVQRLKATYNFNPRAFLRLIGQYVNVDRDSSLYATSVPERSAGFSGSALFSYRINWQTALFLGYGDERALDAFQDLARTDRQIFAKLSYAFQR